MPFLRIKVGVATSEVDRPWGGDTVKMKTIRNHARTLKLLSTVCLSYTQCVAASCNRYIPVEQEIIEGSSRLSSRLVTTGSLLSPENNPCYLINLLSAPGFP